MTDDDIAKVRADFETLKAKLRASVDQLEPERYDQITAKLVALDEGAIKDLIAKRRGSHRVERLMGEIERRLGAVEESGRERA